MDPNDEDLPPLLVNAEEHQNTLENTNSVRVPITIVTGYLGAGKTTLLNYILSEQHGKRIAVILNEFGDSADIEKALTINKDGEQVQEWLEVANGCICCTVKDSGVSAIESLMERKGAFDYILLETTGLADPGNLAPLFWVDEGLGSTIYLDGIVTLVDAKNITTSLNETAPEQHEHAEQQNALLTTAHLQISHADVIVINKSDLVNLDELQSVKERVQAINGLAKIHITLHSQVPQLAGFLLDLHAYDDVGTLDIAEKGHSHPDPTISTVAIPVPVLGYDQLPYVDAWLRSILWESRLPEVGTDTLSKGQKGERPFEIHRLKGSLYMDDGTIKFVQGVREIFEIKDATRQSENVEIGVVLARRGKIVLVGRNIAGIKFGASFFSAIERP